jgi:hypothetical protein
MKRVISALIASVALFAAVSGVADAAAPAKCNGPASYCNVFFGQSARLNLLEDGRRGGALFFTKENRISAFLKKQSACRAHRRFSLHATPL